MSKPDADNRTKVSYVSLFWEFFKIGLFTIGGGAVMIPQIQHTVTSKGWMSEEESLDMISLSQSLPGVIAVNAATYVGYRKRGVPGAALASLAIVLPAFFAIVVVMWILGFVTDNPYVDGAFTGIKACAAGLILVTAYNLAVQILRGVKAKGDGQAAEAGDGQEKGGRRRAIGVCFAVAVMLATFVLIAVLEVSIVYIVIGAIVLGIAFHMLMEVRS